MYTINFTPGERIEILECLWSEQSREAKWLDRCVQENWANFIVGSMSHLDAIDKLIEKVMTAEFI